MPFVKKQDRVSVLYRDGEVKTSGQLSYVLSVCMARYVKNKGRNWQTFSDIFGAIAGAIIGFCIEVVFDYETQKLRSNGSIYNDET